MLFKELQQLVNDETKEVKQAAFESLVAVIDIFDNYFKKQDVLPIFLEMMKKPPVSLGRLLISLFGDYVWKLSCIAYTLLLTHV